MRYRSPTGIAVVFCSVVLLTMATSAAHASQASAPTTQLADKPPVSIAVVVDGTLLAGSDAASVRNILTTLFQSLRDDDEYAIFISSEKPVLRQDFTDDPELLEPALQLSAASKMNALYDTIVAAAQLLSSEASNDTRVLIVLSSGVSKGNKASLDEAISAAQEAKLQGFILGFPNSTWRARDTLQQLASKTSGVAFFAAHKSEFPEISRIAAERLMGPPISRAKPLARYSEAIVRSIPVAKLPETAEFQSGDNLLLQKLLVSRLREHKIFPDVVDATTRSGNEYLGQPQPSAGKSKIELAGTIVDFRRGSHLKRGTAGLLGRGASRIKVRFVFRDAVSRKAVLALTEEGVGSGGLLGGGNEQNQIQAMLDVVHRLLEDIKRNR